MGATGKENTMGRKPKDSNPKVLPKATRKK
jgi:hypothetical protein